MCLRVHTYIVIYIRATSLATVTPLVMAGRMAHAKLQNRSRLWRSSPWHGWMGELVLSKINSCFLLFYLNANLSWGDLDGSVATFVSVLVHFCVCCNRCFLGMGIMMFYMIWFYLSSAGQHFGYCESKRCPALPVESRNYTSQILWRFFSFGDRFNSSFVSFQRRDQLTLGYLVNMGLWHFVCVCANAFWACV